MNDIVTAATQARQGILGELRGVTPAQSESKTERESPVTLYVRKLSQEMGQTFYMASEVADRLGVSVQAVRKYGKSEVCGKGVAPSFKAEQGKMKVYLYTPEDVEALRQYLGKRSVVESLGG